MSDAQDRRRVQDTARQVGLSVGVASVLILALGVAILVVVLLTAARPDDDDRGPSGAIEDRVVVDLDHILPVVVVLGVVGAILLASVGWYAARRATRPLADALRMQRHFVSDASHELRTPLTALTSRIQIVQRRYDRGEPIQEPLALLRSDAAAMNEVITDMLQAAEGEATGAQLADVTRSIADAVSALGPIASEHDVRLETEVSGTLTVAVPQVTMSRLCVALVDNAVQHAPAGSVVRIVAAPDGGVVRVLVIDQGRGIAAGDRERVFDRFARGAETGRRRGFGLGLALVREGAARFGGAVSIADTGPEGTTFQLTLPRAGR